MATKEKKPFGETGLGKFLKKAGGVLPEAIDVAAKVATGNIGGAIETIGDALKNKAATNVEAAKLLHEFEQYKMTWELEIERIYADDRKDARSREVEIAKAGKRDIMPAILSIAGLLAFGFALWVITFRDIPQENKELFVHIMGIIEGAMLVNVYNYYFGSSAGSRRKTELTGK